MARIHHDSKRDIFVIDGDGFMKHGAGSAALGWTALVLFFGTLFAFASGGGERLLKFIAAACAIEAIGVVGCALAYARRTRFEVDIGRGCLRRRGTSAKEWPLSAFQRVYLSRQVEVEEEDGLNDLGERRMNHRINFSGPGVAICVAEAGDKAEARKLAGRLAKMCDLPFRDGLMASPSDMRGGRRLDNWEIWMNTVDPQGDRGSGGPSHSQDPERGRGAPRRDSSDT